VKTEIPSACVTVNWKVCKVSDSAVLVRVPSCVYKVSINPKQKPAYKSRDNNILKFG
jgi:hypothetical protein